LLANPDLRLALGLSSGRGRAAADAIGLSGLVTAVADPVSQPTKADDYWIAIGRMRALDCSALRLPNGCLLALPAQVVHAGADGLEIVGSSGMSHISSPSDPLRVPVPRPPSESCSGWVPSNKRLAPRAQPFVRSDAFLTFLKCLSA
jgi:hypothetical protein